MIQVEKYKAFRGSMRITPKNPQFPPQEIYADWLYKPEYDCWYGHGQSFMAEICQVVSDERSGENFNLKTNAEMLHDAEEDEVRSMLMDYFSQWSACGDSYIYDLTRVKEAFAIGTMSFDDFVEWDESRVAELVDEFIAWLKEPASKK